MSLNLRYTSNALCRKRSRERCLGNTFARQADPSYTRRNDRPDVPHLWKCYLETFHSVLSTYNSGAVSHTSIQNCSLDSSGPLRHLHHHFIVPILAPVPAGSTSLGSTYRWTLQDGSSLDRIFGGRTKRGCGRLLRTISLVVIGEWLWNPYLFFILRESTFGCWHLRKCRQIALNSFANRSYLYLSVCWLSIIFQQRRFHSHPKQKFAVLASLSLGLA